MAADQTVRVTGLVDLQRALRRMDRSLPKEMAAGLADAAEIAAKAVKPKVPWLTGAARGSVVARKQQRGASLSVGGPGAEHYPWLDFGGRVGRNKSANRPVVRGGRYLFPALAAKNDEVKAKVDERVERLARLAGFDQTGRSDRGT